ncbi:MAG: YaaR family protein [Treponema sp.]|jgi:uncharacterized protein YaaR (DUF327 family)|nr:YaaR family protein [Treponema sp.]
MAKVDSADIPAFYMNPSAYSQVKTETKKTKGMGVQNGGKTDFSRMFEEIRGKTAEELGPLQDMPVSEETLNVLMDDVRNTGDLLRSRPFPGEMLRYKQAVRNFMHYVVENSYALEHEAGIKKYRKPGYNGPRGTPEANAQLRYTRIQVIDTKLEDLAAMLLSGQKRQLEIAARLEEIQGLLVDLLQ